MQQSSWWIVLLLLLTAQVAEARYLHVQRHLGWSQQGAYRLQAELRAIEDEVPRMRLQILAIQPDRTIWAWSGQDANLLDFAERHGVAVNSGCRSGSCGGCETAVASGTVRNAVAPDHDVAEGHCLLCVATPGTALVLDA